MIGVGVIGCGFLCQNTHLKNLFDDQRFSVEAVADIDEVVRQDIAAKYSIKDIFQDHRDLLKLDRIQVVVITVARVSSGALVLEALRAGKSVFVEKPMCLTETMAEKILIAAKENKKDVLVGFMKRADFGVKSYKERLSQRPFSQIRLIRAYCFMGDSYCDAFQIHRDENLVKSLGAYKENCAPEIMEVNVTQHEQFLNVVSHTLSLFRFLFNAPFTFAYGNVDDQNNGLICGRVGQTAAIIELVRGNQRHWSEGFEVVYEDESLCMELPPPLLRGTSARVYSKYCGDQFDRREFSIEHGWSFKGQLDKLFNMIEDGGINFEDILLSIECIKTAKQVIAGKI